jgi:hypothetical protein
MLPSLRGAAAPRNDDIFLIKTKIYIAEYVFNNALFVGERSKG